MASTDTYSLSDSDFLNHFSQTHLCDVKKHINDSTDSFSVLHVNIRSFHSKMEQFELFLAELDVSFSCIVISETWFSSSTFTSKFFINNYKLFFNSREHGNGGGICVYVNDKFDVGVEDVTLESSNSLLLRIGESGRHVCTLLSIYRAPSGDLPAFIAGLTACLSRLPSHSFVVGDINIDLNSENSLDNNAVKYRDTINEYGFHNIITSPTRYGSTKASLIDHILTNNLKFRYQTFTIKSDLSDHLPVCASFVYKKTKPIFKPSNPVTINKIDYIKLKKVIQDFDWNSVCQIGDTDLAFEKCVDSFHTAIKESSTAINFNNPKLNLKQFRKYWMTKELFKLISKRARLHEKAKKQPFNNTLQKSYRSFRNFVTLNIKTVRSKYYEQKFLKCKDNQNEKWKFVKDMLNKTRADASSSIKLNVEKFGESKILEEPKLVAEEFNTFFVNIGAKLAAALPSSTINFTSFMPSLSNTNLSELNFQEIDACDLLPIIENLSIKKATGYDNISIRAVKENKLTIIPILVYLTNLVIENSVFPQCMKVARVTPLLKKGDTTDCNNYRPISILSVISKIIERVLAMQITEHMELNSLLVENQFGFRKGRSTTDAIHKLMEDLYINFNSRTITHGIFLDFSKAFDTIDHEILVKKLKYYNFSSQASQLIKHYLTNRKQFVKIDNFSSSHQNINLGVPQGSVLGPLLFLIYINDLVNAVPDFNCILFADDTNIFSTNFTILKEKLFKIEHWCLANRLILNCKKTLQITFRPPNNTINIDGLKLELNNTIIENIPQTKFLGITLDYSINFKTHLLELRKKLNLCLCMMRAIRPYLNQKIMIEIYYSFFYPHLLYGIEFYGHACKTDINKILLLQKACLRIILNLKARDHVTSNFKKLKIMPIDMLFEFRTLKLLLRNYSVVQLNNLKSSHQYNTRSNSLQPIRTNNRRGERSLLSNGIALYNRYLLGVEAGALFGQRDGLSGLLWAFW